MGVLALGLHTTRSPGICVNVWNGPGTHAGILMVPFPHPSACTSKRPGQELLDAGSYATCLTRPGITLKGIWDQRHNAQ